MFSSRIRFLPLLFFLVSCIRPSSIPPIVQQPVTLTDLPLVTNTFVPSPTGTPSVKPPTPTDTPAPLTQTPLPATRFPTQTSAPEEPLSPLSQQSLKEIPLSLGNSWVYEYRAYAGDLKAAWQVAENVTEVIVHPPFIAAHLQREITWLEGPASLQPQPPAGSFWYVIDGPALYRVEGDLNWAGIRSSILEVQFPLPGSDCWFPDPSLRSGGRSSNVPGCRQASGPAALRLPAGAFERCFQLLTPNSNGSLRQDFCSGIGLVQEQFDHQGSVFGYQWILIAYAFL